MRRGNRALCVLLCCVSCVSMAQAKAAVSTPAKAQTVNVSPVPVLRPVSTTIPSPVPRPVQASVPATVSSPVPRAALAYRRLLVRTARMVFGMNAPVATLAAQIHQESLWRSGARSFAGAEGLAQFMPKTGTWIASLYPELGAAAPYNPAWAVRAMCRFDKWLFVRTKARAVDSACERAAFTLSAYNGGETWVRRDQAATKAQGEYDSKRYFGHSERANAGRSKAAWRENRNYARRILGQWENLYEEAGWGLGMCAALPPAPA